MSKASMPKVKMSAFKIAENAPESINRKIGLTKTRAKTRMMPFPTALSFSTGLHFVTPVLILLLIALIAWLLGLDFTKWFNPPKKPDMVFALVKDTKAEAPDEAKFRGEFNQRAGGKRTDEELKPPEKVSTPSPEAQQEAKPQTEATPPKPQQQLQKPQPQQQAQQPQPQQPKPRPQKPDKAPPMPKPAFKPTIPMPSKATPQPKTTTQSPSGPVAKAQQASQATPSSRPSPVQIANQGAIAMASPRSMGNTSAGSPQGGQGEDGVDVMADEDLGALISDVTRRIKRNWMPPRAAQTRRIVVRFILARDGRVLERKILQSSGDPLSDESAIRALDVSAPFRPFPPTVRRQSVPIEFTFDYNVLLNKSKAAR